MKKLFALLLAVIMVVCIFASCGAAAEPKDDEKEVLTMATNPNFPPYEYFEGGEIVGIDAEIAQAIADKLGMELEIVETEFGSIVGGVQTGKYDMGMAGMTVTEERMKSFNFSDSYATGIQAVVVPEDSDITCVDDLYAEIGEDGTPISVKDGVTIGVQEDTTGDIYCSDTPENFGFGEDHVVSYKNPADAIQALIAGKHTAVIIDNEPAKSFVAQNEGLKILDGAYTEENYAICVAKENTDLLEKINGALADLTEDGTIAEIVEKYIPSK